MTKPKILALVAFLLGPLALHAQNANVAVPNSTPAVQATPEPIKTRLTGRVIYEDTGKPVRRAKFGLYRFEKRSYDETGIQSLERAFSADAVTNDEGEFNIEALEPGDYYPKIDVPGVLSFENYYYLLKRDNRIRVEKLDELFQKVTIVAGAAEQQTLVVAKRGGAIDGRVAYADGTPVPGIEVTALQDGEYGYETTAKTTTDDRGYYRLNGLTPGEFVIRIVEPSYQKSSADYYNSSISQIKTYYGDTPELKTAKRLTLAAAEEKNGIDITIADRRTFSIVGRVVQRGSKDPVKGLQIKLENKGDDDLSYKNKPSYNIKIDQNGGFRINDLPKGEYKITTVQDYIYGPERSKTQQYAEASREIVIDDKNLENVVIEVTTAARISGVLTFDDKREIKNVSFIIFDDDKKISSFTYSEASEYREARKDKTNEWKFMFDDVGEGEFSPFIASENFYIKSATIDGEDWLAAPFAVREKTEITNARIVIGTDVGEIKGKAELAAETNTERLRVVFVPIDRKGAISFLKVVNVQDNREFSQKLAPGDYYVSVHTEEELVAARKIKINEWMALFSKDAERVTVKPKETIEVTIKK
ncbi:MAG: carboxypeptidase regulatory-like domain-containing protein [Acidobacteria bacterium]|nr:carboxypeptidase regulatory-like domain-containing protein [Acidobacteriota bacterium]